MKPALQAGICKQTASFEMFHLEGRCFLLALLKALPHNSSAALAMPFLPSASCRNLDLPPVNLRFLQSHLTKNAFAIAPTHLCGIALGFAKLSARTQLRTVAEDHRHDQKRDAVEELTCIDPRRCCRVLRTLIS